jgi:hypothetical protein
VKGRVKMWKYVILAVLVGAAVFAAVSLASGGSGSGSQAQFLGEMKTVDGHPMATAKGNALGVKAAAKGHRFGLRYLFAEFNLAADQTKGRVIRCPKKWHPVSGLHFADSNQVDRVVTVFDAPTSTRKWGISVRNEASKKTRATIGAVCVKGLPVRGSG